MPDISTSALLVAMVALVAGLARGFSGFGAALIFVPLAGAIVAPRVAGPVLALIDLVFAAPLLLGALGKADRREVGLMLLGALAGIPAGTAVLASLPPLTLRWLICGFATAMLALLLSGWRYAGRPHAAAIVGTGAVSGLFSGIAQIGGPPVVGYWLGTGAEPLRLRANVILFFFASGIISFASYFAGGLVTREVGMLALVAGPGYGLGTFAGARMFGWASKDEASEPFSLNRRSALSPCPNALLIGKPLHTFPEALGSLFSRDSYRKPLHTFPKSAFSVEQPPGRRRSCRPCP